MNKKRIIYLIVVFFVVIAFVFIWLFVSFQNKQNQQEKNNNKNTISNHQKRPTARNAANWDEPFLKEIKVEFMDKEELNKMGLANDPMYSLQVLERDENGKPTAYKKVYKEEDIIRYVYDSNMVIIPTSTIATSTATGTPAR